MVKCEKNFVVPTNKWLTIIKQLIDEYGEDHFNKPTSFVYDSDFIDKEAHKERVIVKVSNTNNIKKSIEPLYRKIDESPYIAKIYCFLECPENKKYFKTKYNNVYGFCNVGKDGSKIVISLEVMKRYESSLRKFEETLNINTMMYFLRYLLLIQLELYTKYDFVHNDIHLGNILTTNLKKQNKRKTFTFLFENKGFDITTEILLVLTDFEDALILDNETKKNLLDKKTSLYPYTLEKNIYNTFECAIKLIKDEKERYKLNMIFEDLEDENIKEREKLEKSFIDFCSGKIRSKEYKPKVIDWVEKRIKYMFKKLLNTEFIMQ